MDKRRILFRTSTRVNAHTLHLSWFVYVVTVSVNIVTICYSFPRTECFPFLCLTVKVYYMCKVDYFLLSNSLAYSVITLQLWTIHVRYTTVQTCLSDVYTYYRSNFALIVVGFVRTLNHFCLCSILRLLFILCALIYIILSLKSPFLLINVNVS